MKVKNKGMSGGYARVNNMETFWNLSLRQNYLNK